MLVHDLSSYVAPLMRPNNEINLLKSIGGLAFTTTTLTAYSAATVIRPRGNAHVQGEHPGQKVLSCELCKGGHGLTMDPRLYFCCDRVCRSLAVNHGLMQTESSRILSPLIVMPM